MLFAVSDFLSDPFLSLTPSSISKGFRNFAWAGRHGIRKTKAQLELILVRDVKENKRSFCAVLAAKG